MNSLADYLSGHPLFSKLPPEYLQSLEGCAQRQRYAAGDVILKTHTNADAFFVITEGLVSLQVHPASGEPVLIQSLREGDVLGWSWMLPPYLWHFDAVARENTATYRLDASCVRGKCEVDPQFGYQLSQCFSRIMLERLMATRLQLLDVYAHPGEPVP